MLLKKRPKSTEHKLLCVASSVHHRLKELSSKTGWPMNKIVEMLVSEARLDSTMKITTTKNKR